MRDARNWIDRRGVLALAALLVIGGCSSTDSSRPAVAGTPPKHAPSAPSPAPSGPFGLLAPPADVQQACDQVGCPHVVRPAGLLPSALLGPVHLPRVGPGQPCPVTAGTIVHGADFGGLAFGSGPVHAVVGQAGDNAPRGQFQMPAQPYADGWFSWKTLWYSEPGYQGPWRVRGGQLDGDSPVAFGESPTLSEIVVVDSTALGSGRVPHLLEK